MKVLLADDSFVRVLFDTIPAWVFVLDAERRIYAANRAARELIGCTEEDYYLHRCGGVIGCIHCGEQPRGCGHSPHCDQCVVRTTSLAAIQGAAIQRAKGKLDLQTGETLNVLVSASAFVHQGQTYAVTIIEDVSLVVELQGLIPICASCKRIRDDRGYWNWVEQYIERHSEAEFTHDICPECVKKLYPQLVGVAK
jgi:PAS domain-containing protein